MTTLTSTHCGVHRLIADVTVMSENQILMMRTRGGTASRGHDGWFLPDDYVGDLEHPDDAARRILEEQTNVSAQYVNLSHIESFVAGDGTWNLAFHYAALARSVGDVESDETQEIRWFDIEALPDSSEVASYGRPLTTVNRAVISVRNPMNCLSSRP